MTFLGGGRRGKTFRIFSSFAYTILDYTNFVYAKVHK